MRTLQVNGVTSKGDSWSRRCREVHPPGSEEAEAGQGSTRTTGSERGRERGQQCTHWRERTDRQGRERVGADIGG